MPSCKSCGKSCADWGELAQHIATSKKGHRNGKRWAAHYLQRQALRTRIAHNGNGGEPPSKEARESANRELSGDTALITTICPKCRGKSAQRVPAEYAHSPQAWRTKTGTLQITCKNCGGGVLTNSR